jgi:hypothetical protein
MDLTGGNNPLNDKPGPNPMGGLDFTGGANTNNNSTAT